MTKTPPTEPRVQLCTRLSKPLVRDMKMHCVQQDETIQAFVEAALREKLARDQK